MAVLHLAQVKKVKKGRRIDSHFKYNQ